MDWSSDVFSSDLGAFWLWTVSIAKAFSSASRAARSLISSLSVSDCAYFQSATTLSRWIFLRFSPSAIVTITDSNSPTGPARCQLTGSHVQLPIDAIRSEEHTSELQSLMRISYAVICLKK